MCWIDWNVVARYKRWCNDVIMRFVCEDEMCRCVRKNSTDNGWLACWHSSDWMAWLSLQTLSVRGPPLSRPGPIFYAQTLLQRHAEFNGIARVSCTKSRVERRWFSVLYAYEHVSHIYIYMTQGVRVPIECRVPFCRVALTSIIMRLCIDI